MKQVATLTAFLEQSRAQTEVRPVVEDPLTDCRTDVVNTHFCVLSALDF